MMQKHVLNKPREPRSCFYYYGLSFCKTLKCARQFAEIGRHRCLGAQSSWLPIRLGVGTKLFSVQKAWGIIVMQCTIHPQGCTDQNFSKYKKSHICYYKRALTPVFCVSLFKHRCMAESRCGLFSSCSITEESAYGWTSLMIPCPFIWWCHDDTRPLLLLPPSKRSTKQLSPGMSGIGHWGLLKMNGSNNIAGNTAIILQVVHQFSFYPLITLKIYILLLHPWRDYLDS